SYRFDNVPNGVYAVELRFAAPSDVPEEQQEFDVIVEDDLVLPAYDPAARSGFDQASEHTFYVPVTDGQLDVRFSPRVGRPFVNALRVTHRPDR
ncbi:MAG TPA: malectin domain-containing carbohydrate-binding protein, partial [Polyangiales bacterium]|nr:malectin domain-containing carbohydrate-binding protein [Polyangiales bacterium]